MAVIELKALELKIPADPKGKDQYLSLVIKRGAKERLEDMDDKIKYTPLSDDPEDIEKNRAVYKKILATNS